MNPGVDRIAWEDGAMPFPASLGLTWWECMVSPDRFFRRVAWSGPFSRPLLYFLIVTVLAGLFGLFWFVWGPWEPGVTLELQLLGFFLTPFAVLLALGFVALVQHMFVALMAPERRGLGATATVLCYASGVGLVSAVLPPPLAVGRPVLAAAGMTYLVLYVLLALAVQVWYVFVLVIGLRQAHSMTTGRAAAAVLLPIVIGMALGLVLIAVGVALAILSDLPV